MVPHAIRALTAKEQVTLQVKELEANKKNLIMKKLGYYQSRCDSFLAMSPLYSSNNTTVHEDH